MSYYMGTVGYRRVLREPLASKNSNPHSSPSLGEREAITSAANAFQLQARTPHYLTADRIIAEVLS